MKKFKGIVLFLVLLGAAILLHYNLPDRDIVRIIDTEVSRVDKQDGSFGRGEPDVGTERLGTIDVRYISTKRPNGKPMVYRNQDTGLGWPPYFKFDTGDLMAEAQDLAAQNGNGEQIWVAVKHYGWRIKVFSLYPNAISIKRVDGPNTRIIPWFNIAFLSLLAFIVFFIWRKTRRWSQKNIAPHTEKIREELEDAADALGAQKDKAGKELAEKQSAMKGFMRRWFGSS